MVIVSSPRYNRPPLPPPSYSSATPFIGSPFEYSDDGCISAEEKRLTWRKFLKRTVICNGRGRSEETVSPIGTADNGVTRGRQSSDYFGSSEVIGFRTRYTSSSPADTRVRPRVSGSGRRPPAPGRLQHREALHTPKNPKANTAPRRYEIRAFQQTPSSIHRVRIKRTGRRT